MKRPFLVIIALIAGLLFLSTPTASFAAASKSQAAKKQKWKKPHAKKNKG
jgi:uncharacterized alpha/beta hydrolase family protein